MMYFSRLFYIDETKRNKYIIAYEKQDVKSVATICNAHMLIKEETCSHEVLEILNIRFQISGES